MAHLPITRMTLYKHGVGFFERRAAVSTDRVELSFRVEEMNDILKSLTVLDWSGGQVLGIDYATPQSREERLAGCSIQLADDRSLQDLLTSLRGRQVTLHLDQEETIAGTLVGLDEVPERQPLSATLVSLLCDEAEHVRVVTLARVQGVELLDEQGAGDLRFFLQTALSQENYRSVTIRLTPGDHDLSVSYIAPAPTWRVSYRLVAEPAEDATEDTPPGGRALLQGWGIFDNRLEEDLESIALSLVAGMPISFIYNLYTPFTPERPVIEEEGRVAAGPVAFGAGIDTMIDAVAEALPPSPDQMARSLGGAGRMTAKRSAPRMGIEALQQAAAVETVGSGLGELFQYSIGTPVTVSRGHSAMVPIMQATLPYRKNLIYNGRKMPVHPVATMRLDNKTGLTLEQGPVTVLETGEYMGEAVLPFTVVGSEMVIPYAVELGVKISEHSGARREIRGLDIKGAYLRFEEWDIRWHEYQINNTTANPVILLVEHARTSHHELFDTPEPTERTADQLRFEMKVPLQSEVTLTVHERRLTRRREEIQRQSFDGLQEYLQQGLLKQREMSQLTQLLTLWESVAENEQHLARVKKARGKIYKAQQQVQGNMKALGQTGKEGTLRARYVAQLETTEEQLRALELQEAQAKGEIKRIKGEIDTLLKRIS